MRPFFFLILLMQSVQLIGQPYLNETSRWEQVYRATAFPGVTTLEEIAIQIVGDTVIGSTTYHQLLKTGIHLVYYNDPQKGDTIENEVIYEFLDPIREADKMFIAYSLAEQHEYVMYDFSGMVGDTLINNDCNQNVIQRIDTLYLGNEPRKQFHLPPYSPNIEFSTLIEGVGSTFGFGYPVCNTNWSTSRYLRCFYQDGNHIQIYPNFGTCDFVNVADYLDEVEFSISPNPFSEEIEIRFSNGISETVVIAIVNLVGTVVFEKQIQNQSSAEYIPLPDLPAGIYVVCVKGKNKIWTNRIVRQ